MVLVVNIPSSDAYKHYFDIYDATGSALIVSNEENKSLSVERKKSGLKADFSFISEGESKSKIIIKATMK